MRTTSFFFIKLIFILSGANFRDDFFFLGIYVFGGNLEELDEIGQISLGCFSVFII